MILIFTIIWEFLQLFPEEMLWIRNHSYQEYKPDNIRNVGTVGYRSTRNIVKKLQDEVLSKDTKPGLNLFSNYSFLY